MTHPHQLHATRAAWALHHAHTALTDAITRAATADPADGIRSTTWGQRGSGAMGDPVSAAALTTGPDTRYRLLLDRTGETLTWLAGRATPGPGDPLTRITAAIPTMPPTTAVEVTRWLDDLAQRIRRDLRLAPAEQPLPDNPPCPACSARMLRVHTAAPNPTQWTATCGAGCPCAGPGCPCGMTTRAADVAHIWTRDALYAALRTARRRTRTRTAA